ncbi:hypothetical protein Q1695_007011 [Nippostrongylus brasiliensis]|nr:hypothetical protein Q1695_007011 [Nippostrongylus brasiliensis]
MRAIWEPYCRRALTRAMAGVRQYSFEEDQLIPRPKRRVVVEGVEEEVLDGNSASTTDGEGEYTYTLL